MFLKFEGMCTYMQCAVCSTVIGNKSHKWIYLKRCINGPNGLTYVLKHKNPEQMWRAYTYTRAVARARARAKAKAKAKTIVM